MSAPELQAALLEILRSDAALAQYEDDTGAFARRHGLDATEEARLRERNMGWLYEQGVHPYILAQFALTIRFDMAEYASQIRSVTDSVDQPVGHGRGEADG